MHSFDTCSLEARSSARNARQDDTGLDFWRHILSIAYFVDRSLAVRNFICLLSSTWNVDCRVRTQTEILYVAMRQIAAVQLYNTDSLCLVKLRSSYSRRKGSCNSTEDLHPERHGFTHRCSQCELAGKNQDTWA